MSQDKTIDVLAVAAKAAGEYVAPGGSNFVKGDIKEGAKHAALGLAARALFGLPGLIVISANSLTQAVTGRGIHQHLGLWQDCGKGGDASTLAPAQAATE